MKYKIKIAYKAENFADHIPLMKSSQASRRDRSSNKASREDYLFYVKVLKNEQNLHHECPGKDEQQP